MTVTIRSYNDSDLDALIALFRISVRTIARRDYTHEQVMAWAPDDIDRALWGNERASKPTWVAVLADKQAGFIDLEPDGHIDMLYVDADHQRSGIATLLLNTAEQMARNNNLPLLCTEASITARPFFEHCGFDVISSQTVSVRGQAFVNFRMCKQLPQ